MVIGVGHVLCLISLCLEIFVMQYSSEVFFLVSFRLRLSFSFPVPVALKSVHAHWCVMGKYSWQDGGR